MKVKDVMNKEVITCKPDDPLSVPASIFKEKRISGMPVVENDKVVGLISETDLLELFRIPEFSNNLWLPSPFEVIEMPIRSLVRYEEVKKLFEKMKTMPVRDIMSSQVYTISEENTLEEASSKMVKHKINRLPVIENGKLVGIVARSDIIKGLSEIQE